jgi:hypothetical protein
MSQNGKGSRFRPKGVSEKTWEQNWKKIFGKKQKKSSWAVDKPIRRDRIQESKRENQSRD